MGKTRVFMGNYYNNRESKEHIDKSLEDVAKQFLSGIPDVPTNAISSLTIALIESLVKWGFSQLEEGKELPDKDKFHIKKQIDSATSHKVEKEKWDYRTDPPLQVGNCIQLPDGTVITCESVAAANSLTYLIAGLAKTQFSPEAMYEGLTQNENLRKTKSSDDDSSG